MNSLRFEALNSLVKNSTLNVSVESDPEAQFAQNVFNDLALQRSLNQQAYDEI